MQFRSPNTVREEPGDITKPSDSNDEGNLGMLPRRSSTLSESVVTSSTGIFLLFTVYMLIMDVSKALVPRGSFS